MRSRPDTSKTTDSTTSLPTILSADQWTAVAKELRLTPRQAEVAYLILQAKKDKEVAAALGLSVSTVRMHLRYVFNQLDVSDRMGLALRVFHIVCRDAETRQSK